MVHPSRLQWFSFPHRTTLAAGAALTLLAGCGGDDNPGDRQVQVQFAGQVNGQEFVCGRIYAGVGVGQPGTYQVNDWRFYIHDVALVRTDGSRQTLALDQDGIWQYQNLALLDLRKDCGSGALPTNAAVAGAVPDADYTGICFKVGVPYSLNHINDATAPSPLNASGMLWNWRGGRKFIRVDGGKTFPTFGDKANPTKIHRVLLPHLARQSFKRFVTLCFMCV